jgi:hypothetical protein
MLVRDEGCTLFLAFVVPALCGRKYTRGRAGEQQGMAHIVNTVFSPTEYFHLPPA